MSSKRKKEEDKERNEEITRRLIQIAKLTKEVMNK